MTPRNVAVGGSKVGDVLTGGSSYVALLENLVENPTSRAATRWQARPSQIDRLEMLDPDVAFTTDLLGNDMDMAVIQTDDVHPELATPLDAMQAGLTQMMARLGALHGQYFIANMPSLTVVPNVAVLRAQRIAAGTSTDDFDAKVKQLDDLTDGYNAALVHATAPYPNLHIVDFKGQVAAQRGGVRVGGEWLTSARFGGLFSLDGLHLTDSALRRSTPTCSSTPSTARGRADRARRRRRHPRRRPGRTVGAARGRPDLRAARDVNREATPGAPRRRAARAAWPNHTAPDWQATCFEALEEDWMRRGAIIALLLVTLAGCGGTQSAQGGNGAPADDQGSSTMTGDLGETDGGTVTASTDMATSAAAAAAH